MLADLGEYLTTEEQQTYIAAYLDEGRFDTGGFKIFPVAKSTELLSVNKTEWDAFSAATGASEADLATWEGIASLAERYYDWTDARTPGSVRRREGLFRPGRLCQLHLDRQYAAGSGAVLRGGWPGSPFRWITT